MTLQPQNGAPSFYTFANFHPGRNALLYGAALSVISFCAVALIFNYGIREKLWSFQTAQPLSIEPSYATPMNSAAHASSAAPETITRVWLADSVLHSLEGVYFSAEVNRTYLIAVDGRRIYLQIDHQEPIELIPVSEDTLYAGEGHLIKFRADGAGQVDRLEIYNNGQHIVARRP
ncbi:MAG: hypothetical protein ACM3SW_00340 [Actinomycetota bacterium]